MARKKNAKIVKSKFTYPFPTIDAMISTIRKYCAEDRLNNLNSKATMDRTSFVFADKEGLELCLENRQAESFIVNLRMTYLILCTEIDFWNITIFDLE